MRTTAKPLALLCLLAAAAAAFLLPRGEDHASQPPRASSLLRPGVAARDAAVPAPARAARAALRSRLGGRAVVETDRRTGGVRIAGRLDGPLTGRRDGDPARGVLAYVRRHRDAFGLDGDDLAGLRLTARERTRRLTVLRWEQRVGGVPVEGAGLHASVARDGRVVSVGGGAVADLAERVPDPHAGVRLTARDARRAARRATGGPLGDLEATKLVLTTATGDLRPAWHVVRRLGAESVLDQLVDARTGAELRRFDRMRHATAKAYRHWPGAPVGGAPATFDITGWLTPGATELAGPYVKVFADVDGNDTQGPGEEIGPDANGDWAYDRTPFTGPMCPAAGCSWNRQVPWSWQVNTRQSGTQLFVSLHDFRSHLASAPIGFDGFTGAGGRIVARVMTTAAVDGGLPADGNNARMYTPRTGSPSLYAYLWGGRRAPSTNSADDASLMWHEYAHGLNARTVVDAEGWSRMNGRQSGAMDEGLADFWALDRLVERQAIVDTSAPGEVQTGAGHADPLLLGRSMPVDCPLDAAAAPCDGREGALGGYTYGDLGRVGSEPEVHLDGEIIAQALWDLRTRMIADLGGEAGLERLRGLLADALRSLPVEPTYLDLRNALLQQDATFHGGSSADRIWEVFAARGMGWKASSADGDDVDVHEDFALPPATPDLPVAGTVTDRVTGDPIAGARVALGGHETDEEDRVARTDAQGRYVIGDVPAGTYPELFVSAQGYADGVVTDVAAGSTRDVGLRRNWADVRAGAELVKVVGPSWPDWRCGAAEALDGDRLSGWYTEPGADTASLTVRLPRTIRLTSIGIDPTPRPKQGCSAGDATQPAQVRLEVSGETSGGAWQQVLDEELSTGRRHALTELRPAAPVDRVRRVRLSLVRAHAGTNVSLAELQVYAAAALPPRAALTADPDLPAVDDEITLDASASREGGAPIVAHRWDLDGNGSFEHDGGDAPRATVTFATAGVRRVGVQVTDANGETDEAHRTLVVGTDVAISDLGSLPEDDTGRARALGLNDRLVISGSGSLGDDARPWRYRGGAMTALPTPAGRPTGIALNVGAAGHVAGLAASTPTSADHRAILWSPDGEPADLGTFGGGQAAARDVDAHGTVVGWAEDASLRKRAFIRTATGGLEDIEERAGVPAAQRRGGMATRISSNGIVVGCLRTDGQNCEEDAFRFDSATNTLRRLPGLGGTASAATTVNAAGVAGGWSRDAGATSRPVRWTADGGLERLGTLGGEGGSVVDINDAGLTVGTAEDAGGQDRAVRWDGTTARDLNALVEGSGWLLRSAQSVNARGEVVGYGTKGGRERAWLLNLGPCRVCVESVRFEQRAVPSGDWEPVAASGVVDGAVARAVVRVRSDDPDQTHLVRVEARDETAKQDAAPSEHVGLSPGEEQDVVVDLDTEGWAWDAAGRPLTEHVLRFVVASGRTRFAARGAALTVRPRPLVLLHGQFGGPADFGALKAFAHDAHPGWPVYAIGDGAVDGELRTGSWADLDAPLATPADNGDLVQAYVERVRAATGAQRVDVVAHHFGGLIARQWIHDHVPAPAAEGDLPRVAHLVQLGAPNAGTPCAELLAIDWFDMRRDVVAAFNAEVTDRKGVPFTAVAGLSSPQTCGEAEAGDGQVGVSSAEWRIGDRARAVVHSDDITASGSVWAAAVLPRLNGSEPVDAAPAPAAPRPSARSARAAAAGADGDAVERSHQLLGERRATLGAGGSAELAFDVDGGAALSADVAAPRDVTVRLVAPDGTVAATAPRGGVVRTVTADAPAAGRWRVRLTRDGGEGDVEVAAVARLADDPWDLDLRVGRAAAGGTTPIVAAVTRGPRRVKDADVRVELRRRGAGPATVSLHDDGAHGDGEAGDGCYGGAADAPAGPTLTTLSVQSGDRARLRRTLVDVAAAAGDGEAVRCPPAAGRNGEIAFAHRQASRSTWATVDGTTEAPLPRVPDGARDAAYSPDGTRVAWTTGDTVQVAELGGGAARTLAGGDGLARRGVAWSAGGDRLAYALGCASGPDRPSREAGCGIAVVEVDAQAPAEHEILRDGAPLGGDEPTWSPRGDRIAFVAVDRANGLGRTELFTVRLDGTGLRQLTHDTDGLAQPAWSPRGDRIAFTAWDAVAGEDPRAADRDVYVVDADGSGGHRVTDDGTCDLQETGTCAIDDDEQSPAWSPDGRRLAFVSTRGEPVDPDQDVPLTSQVWEARADGQGLRRLTSSATRKAAPAWRALPFLLDASAPSCDPIRARVERGQAVRIPLSCGDANGDDLALRIVAPPATGQLSGIAADGSVRFTAPDATGEVTFTYTASDGTADAPAATVTVEVVDPPPPPPPPPADDGRWPTDGSGSGGSGSGGSGGSGSGGSGGGTSPLPPGCTYNPVTGTCDMVVGCPRLGGAIDNCIGRFFQAPSGARAAMVAPAKLTSRSLLRPLSLRIPAGKTRRARLRLTPRGRALIKRHGRVRIRVRREIVVRGRAVSRETRTVTFRLARRRR